MQKKEISKPSGRVENLAHGERIALVKGIFSRVAPTYDLFNRLLSLRRDVFWRQAAARRARVFKTRRLLDLAAGTGDLALALAEKHPQAMVFALDFTQPMLARAQEKTRRKNLSARIIPVGGDALNLPFPNGSFDAATMAFGIRNIPDRLRALKEIHRVLAPGGSALILELTFPQWAPARRFYDVYLNRLIPWAGTRLSGYGPAYRYLADSIMDFPNPDEFRRLMIEAGFEDAYYLEYTLGTAVLQVGRKPGLEPPKDE